MTPPCPAASLPYKKSRNSRTFAKFEADRAQMCWKVSVYILCSYSVQYQLSANSFAPWAGTLALTTPCPAADRWTLHSSSASCTCVFPASANCSTWAQTQEITASSSARLKNAKYRSPVSSFRQLHMAWLSSRSTCFPT